MTKIDMIIHYDHLHKSIKDTYFDPSFKKYLSTNFNLIDFFDENKELDGSYLSDHWSNMIIKRFDIIKEYISKNLDSQKTALFTDIDIIFLNNIYEDIIKISYSHYDIVYMSEGLLFEDFMINGGFFVFKCSSKTFSFFDNIQYLTKNSILKNDQPIIQKYLSEYPNDLNITILDRHLFCTNNNPKQIAERLIPSMKVFHATSASNIIEKNQVLSTILLKKEFYTNPKTLLNKNLWI